MAATDVWAPCGWDVTPPECCPAWDDATVTERDRVSRMAAVILWSLTGRQFGRCPVVLRPCRKKCTTNFQVGPWGGTWGSNSWQPYLNAGVWTNVRCGCGSHSCSCTEICEVALPGWLPEPVAVQVDGDVLPADAYRVDNGRWLVRTNGGCFPDCQDLGKVDGEEGTWSVELLTGLPVPPEGMWAAGQLACELIKACDGGAGGQCRLPSNMQSLSRQGVDIEFNQIGQAVGNGALTGIPDVDMWVRSVNPHGVTQPVAVYSPDVQTGRFQTWP